MKLFLAALTFLSLAVSFSSPSCWSEEAELDRIQDSLISLQDTPSGRDLIQRALSAWKLHYFSELRQNFKWGSASRTDTVLTRHLDTKTGKEQKDRKVAIFLKEDQSDGELVLDMSHELVHAAAPPSFDPYDPFLSASKYIRGAIENTGGEIEAVATECQIALELRKKFQMPIDRCKPYIRWSAQKSFWIDRESIKRDFYRVGQWYPELLRQLGPQTQNLPPLSQLEPRFFSSTGHAPYPVALLREFQEITEMACANSKTRMRSVSSAFWQSAIISKAYSQEKDHSLEKDVQNFIEKRCSRQ